MQRFAGLAAPMKLAASVAGSARGGSARRGKPGAISGGRQSGSARHRDDDVPKLVEKAMAGDLAALGTLFDRYAPSVYSFMRFRVDSAAVAEELMQRVFLELVEQLPDYRPADSPFGAWLFGVARDVWTEHARANAGRREGGQAGSNGRPPGRAVVALIGQAIYSLPPTQREVIACRVFAGLSAPETAALMRWSEGSVRDVQHRALSELSQSLGLAQGMTFAPARVEQL